MTSIDELVAHILKKVPTLYLSSGTSTVIPFSDHSYIASKLPKNIVIGDLSSLPPSIELNDQQEVTVSGAISWKELKAELATKNRDVLSWPTEELALVLAGVATSCSGERSFGHGPMRDQILELQVIGHDGKIQWVKTTDKLNLADKNLLEEYQKSYAPFKAFKNAPFPKLENNCDPFIGTEGQLGVVIGAKLKTLELKATTFLFAALPKWEEDYSIHLEIFQLMNKYRGKVRAVELLDSHCLKFLKQEERPVSDQDLIVIEVNNENFDEVIGSGLLEIQGLSDESFFEMTPSKFMQIRQAIPRHIAEENSRLGRLKKGTDAQVPPENFSELLELYIKATKLGIPYVLFGHFGDTHLHFNFLPKSDQVAACEKYLEDFYKDIKNLDGSPFSEHGIGLIKQEFIIPFFQNTHKKMFQLLKQTYDPENIFFPKGYLDI